MCSCTLHIVTILLTQDFHSKLSVIVIIITSSSCLIFFYGIYKDYEGDHMPILHHRCTHFDYCEKHYVEFSYFMHNVYEYKSNHSLFRYLKMLAKT